MRQQTSSPPTGRRVSSPLYREMAARAARFAGLPANVSPYDILRLIKRVGSDLGFTRPGDREPGNRPVVYAQMTAQAVDLAITEEQVRVREGPQILSRILGTFDFRRWLLWCRFPSVSANPCSCSAGYSIWFQRCASA